MPGPDRSGGPGRQAHDHVDLQRGVVLVAVAVILGIILLQVNAKTAPVTASATSAAHHHVATAPPTTTTTTVPRSAVHVLVANGVGSGEFATDFSDELQTQGWSVLPPEDATSTVTASAVYYAPGSRGPALALAKGLGLPSAVVQPLSTTVPVTSAAGANVVLVVGPDLSAKAPTQTTSGNTGSGASGNTGSGTSGNTGSGTSGNTGSGNTGSGNTGSGSGT